jgi:CRISPR-associated protein Cmr3
MFKYLIAIAPLGLLYGSAGRFLSPENLVGRSGSSFPPTAATLSGIFAAAHNGQPPQDLHLAGAFWAKNNDPQNFYVPTPFNCLVNMYPSDPQDRQGFQTGEIAQILGWKGDKWAAKRDVQGKYDRNAWLAINDWQHLKSDLKNKPNVYASPWQNLPHLHPRLDDHQRKVYTDPDGDRGSLFLENAIQMHPETSLIYLSSHPLPDGWYRFGGEGHMVSVHSHELKKSTQDLLSKPVTNSFAIVTAAIWGSNRLSLRFPNQWQNAIIFTERPMPYRYRLGGDGNTKRLSRGRYAVPAGSIYILNDNEQTRQSWQQWTPDLFPSEGKREGYQDYTYKRWGCGLALPLTVDS